MSELLELAERTTARLLALGADEAAVTASQGSHTTLVRRDGKVEQATEATTRGLVVSVLANGRYSSNSTSDLRPEALEAFLRRSVEATRYLEPDPDRALPPAELCGRGVSEAQLDQDDPTWYARTAGDRAAEALRLEQAFEAVRTPQVISAALHIGDGMSEVAQVMSNGFADTSRGCWFAVAAETTLREGDKRPEAAAYYTARHHADLPGPEHVAAEALRRAEERLGAGPIASGNYPLVLLNRTAGRVLGILAGAISGGALHQGQSFLIDKQGQRIASELLHIVDDPTLPRGLGSRPWDGDGLVSRPRTIVRDGVLEQYDLGVYHARKLGMEPTSGSRSNWIVRPGDRSYAEIAAAWPQAILVTSFLGGNSNSSTGDFSFGIRGVLLENGQPTRSLSEMNVSGNALSLFHRLVAVADDPWEWSAVRSPTLVFEDVSFSGA